MNTPRMSDTFSLAFRSALIDHVNASTRTRPRIRWVLGGGGLAILLVAGTATAAATGLLTLPGSTEVTPVTTAETGTFTGTDSVTLGPAPEGATGIVVSLHCLTPGSFTLPGGAGTSCSPGDFTPNGPLPGFDSYLIPINDAEQGILTVTAPDDGRWTLTAAYATAETTDWAVNEAGQSYGVHNERGQPDLIAVMATNNKQGYVLRSDLEEADGTTAMKGFTTPEDALRWQEANAGLVRIIPVYESDGKTRIGDFQVGG